jgi:hypothetical protein
MVKKSILNFWRIYILSALLNMKIFLEHRQYICLSVCIYVYICASYSVFESLIAIDWRPVNVNNKTSKIEAFQIIK